MVDPNREPLEGVVEVDQAEIPLREGDGFFEPGNAAKILAIGAVEVIDSDTNQTNPRRKHAKYIDTRPDDSASPLSPTIRPHRSKRSSRPT